MRENTKRPQISNEKIDDDFTNFAKARNYRTSNPQEVAMSDEGMKDKKDEAPKLMIQRKLRCQSMPLDTAVHMNGKKTGDTQGMLKTKSQAISTK